MQRQPLHYVSVCWYPVFGSALLSARPSHYSSTSPSDMVVMWRWLWGTGEVILRGGSWCTCRGTFARPLSAPHSRIPRPRPGIETWPPRLDVVAYPRWPRHVPVTSCLFLLSLLNTFTSTYGRQGRMAADNVTYVLISTTSKLFLQYCLTF